MKQVMRRYLVREFDELNVLRAPEFKKLSQKEVIEQVRQYIEEAYQDGHYGMLYMLGIPLLLRRQRPSARSPNIEIAVKKAKMQRTVERKTDGKTFEQRIVDLGEKYDVYELERIAVTEGHRAFVEGQQDAAEEFEEETETTLYKRWDATMDEKTRETHRILHGQIKGLQEKFVTVNGEAEAPGKFGVAQEDVNCRCILTPLYY